MGTTVQSIAGRGTLPDGSHSQSGPSQPLFGQRGGNWPQQQQTHHSIESPEASFSTPVQNGGGVLNQSQGPGPSFDGQNSAHQPHRGLNQAQNNAPAAPAGQPPRNIQTPPPGVGAGANNNAAQQTGLERRGPVEFNHAISYVNKIKVSRHLLPIHPTFFSWPNLVVQKP